ncbi:hypothetical protein BDB01DRAFT_715718, partial [Pilobolus umbonatus]
KKKNNLISRGMDCIRKIRWRTNNGPNHRLSHPIIYQFPEIFTYKSSWSTHNTPRNSLENVSIQEEVIVQLINQSTSNPENRNHHSMNNVVTHLSPVNEGFAQPDQSTPAYVTKYTRALHTPSRFLPQNQAVFTTMSNGTILLFNDIASLCFGIDKSFVGKSLITHFLEEPFRKQVYKMLKRKNKDKLKDALDNKGVMIICGTTIPILKSYGTRSIASLWLKQNTADNGDIIYIWIFEEIYETSLSVYVDSDCIIRRILGTMIESYGYETQDIIGKPVNFIVPALSKDDRDSNIEQIDRLKFFGAKSTHGISFPTMITLNRHVAIQKDDLANFVVRITSLPSIEGIMTIDSMTGNIIDLNAVPSKYLFGYSVDSIVSKMNVSDLIPELSRIIYKLDTAITESRSIISSEECLDKLGENKTLYAVHRDGSKFEIDIQLRPIDDNKIKVWITYDRIDALSKNSKRKEQKDICYFNCKDAKQLTTDLSKQDIPHNPDIPKEDDDQPRKHSRPAVLPLRVSSFGAMDESKRLYPSNFFDPPAAVPSSSAPEAEDTKSHPLDEYVLLNVLGQGTYGMAKLAYRKDDPSKKKLVIKYIIKSKIIIDSWIRDRELGSIPMEIHILRKLQKHPHTNCCTLLANAVKHLHQHRIVHRDIKDENIVLGMDGTVHLIDFGCATYFKRGRRFDTFTGTLEYCAPEILKGIPYEGPPQDIWASGVLLYTLIYRENPFYNIDEIIENELRFPGQLSEDSLNLIERMLERDIDKRITIHEVLAHPWFHGL